MAALAWTSWRNMTGRDTSLTSRQLYDAYLNHYLRDHPGVGSPGYVNFSTGVQAQNYWESLQGSSYTSVVNWQNLHPGEPTGSPGYTPEAAPSERPFSVKAEPKNPNKIYNIPFFEAFSKGRKMEKQPGEVGLEIEAEGMNLFDKPIDFWVTHQDGSLRAYKDHPPIEYVLRKPLPRDEIPKALGYLSSKLKRAGSYIHDSPRTSVHVHVNCQTLTIKQIYQYVCLYMIFEEILVDFSGPDRPGNLFCLSAKQADYFVTCLESAIQTENFNEVFSENLRYTSCNTASLGKFGSLEFRSMRGTVDQDLIQLWVDTLLLLKDKALTYGNPKDIVEDFHSLGPVPFMTKIFRSRPDIQNIFLNRSDTHKSLWDGLRMMRDVAYAINWEDQKVVEKKSPEKEPLSQAWLSNHPGADIIGKIHDGIFLIHHYMHDRHYVVNYSTESVEMVFNGSACLFAGRFMYGINPETNAFTGQNSPMGVISHEPTLIS